MQAGRRAFQLFFVEHNYTDPFWFNFDQYFLAFHPQIGKFFIGASVAAAGIPVIPYQLFDWSQNVAWNMQHGFQVDPTALLAARMPIAIMAVITCLALYWLNVMVTSWWHGVLAALYLAGNSDMFRIGRFAMIDMPALCFSLLTIVLVVRVVQALRSGQHGLGWAAIAGVMAGLAVGAKLIAVILVAPAVLALLYEALRCRWKRVGSASKTLVSAILLSGVAALLFYGSNPLLYHQPIAGTLQMLDFVRMIQNSNTYNPTSTPIQRIAAVWENPTFSGPFAHIGLPIDQLLILLGCFVIGIDLWRLPAVRQYHPLDTVVIWMIGSMLMITISLPANLDRYLLPLQPIMAFLQAYGTIWVAHRVVMLVRKRFGSVSTTEASNIY
jgi:4-amino-4-deoxy-L-arabinose transferase-like glycosyltransferase